jgi:hypothetical protein
VASQSKQTLHLLRWSAHVPVSDVQDPLGLGLRGSTRLASRLLFCVTSITPRARYFSFIPWAVYDWQKREKGTRAAFGLRDAIKIREKALVLGCIAHHDGRTCDGGALVGSDNVENWFAKRKSGIDLRKLPFAKNPALGAYFNSLVNLGLFVTEDEVVPSDEDEEVATLTFDDLELSPLGQQLAKAYDSLIGRLESVRNLSAAKRHCTVRSLSEWGKRGGLCELSDAAATDRELLRNIFFARVDQKGESHHVRSRSLLLILELCRKLSHEGLNLSGRAFRSAVYFGEYTSQKGERIQIEWSKPVLDIATRWRMFYFHHYMSVALEGMFAWLVTQVSNKGLAGASVTELTEPLSSNKARNALSELLTFCPATDFGKSTPAELFQHFVGAFEKLDSNIGRSLDERIRPVDAICEERLELVIRSRSYFQSPVGLAVPMILLSLTLARYSRWESTNYGNWLASASSDPYLDLVPPVLAMGLSRKFGHWWARQWKELAEFVLARYVVQQHQSMSYEKTAKGDRCLLEVDGDKITTRPNEVYEKIGMGNPRFRSAVRILKDLGLLLDVDDGITIVTKDGKRLLDEELAKGSRE